VAVQFERAVPIFRFFSLEKAREFYVGFLGSKVDAEHTFGPNAPLYMMVSRGGLTIHLSERHGDATPDGHAYVHMSGVRELDRELSDKNYRHNKPGLDQQEWGMTEVTVIDPFANRITFGEETAKVPA